MIKKFLGEKWFFENFLPGEFQTSTWGFQIEKELFCGKSKFQKIEVFETKEFGKILALDGLVQLSTKHEFTYHEMLVHPAFFYQRKEPEKVLIIGGGDGGALREVAKHQVREIFLVDIDKKVIEVSKKYLPSVSKGGFSDKRLKIFNENALNFVRKYKNYFDVIIDDLTDPAGPSFRLWQTGFYKDILRALKENGVAAFQTAYLKEKFAKKTRENLRKVFPFFKVHKAFVGCFPFDEHTFSFGSKKINFDKVNFETISKRFKKLNLKTKYYSPEIHFASAVLPKYLN
jgi:spermidine synthase